MWRGKVIWSPCELDWLRENKNKQPVDQISVYLDRSRTAVTNKIKELEGKKSPSSAAKGKRSYIGKRKDIQGGLFLRSNWEANFLRILEFQGIQFIYEPRVFFFTAIKRGTLSYMPDIYIPSQDIYVEIKGQLTGKGRTAVKRFFKYYPEEAKKLRAVTGSKNTAASKFFISAGVPIIHYYNELTKQWKNKIPNWE